jgi:hypothetical protein
MQSSKQHACKISVHQLACRLSFGVAEWQWAVSSSARQLGSCFFFCDTLRVKCQVTFLCNSAAVGSTACWPVVTEMALNRRFTTVVALYVGLCIYFYIRHSPVAQQPNCGLGRLIIDFYR